jgi:hypothetical protein
MKTYGGAETAPSILFLSVSWFTEFACNKKTRNNVEISGYDLLRGADSELAWPA